MRGFFKPVFKPTRGHYAKAQENQSSEVNIQAIQDAEKGD
jgi:hypothetical protein